MRKLIPFIVLGGVLLYGCATYDDAPTRPTYDATFPFTSIVSIGNSLTAGFQSGALFLDGQNAPFGSLIAGQLNLGPQTHVNVNYPGISSTPGYGRYELTFGASGPDLIAIPYDTVTFNPMPLLGNLDHPLPYTNLGVPGALLQECLTVVDAATSLAGNSFFDFILRGIGTQLQQTIILQPDLATFWLGNNDILGYATSGGLSPMGPFGADFATFYGLALDSVARYVDYVVVANIPDVTSIPYCTYIGTTYAGMQLYGEVQGEVIALRAGEDYVLLPAKEELAQGLGFSPLAPLTNGVVLDATEAELVINTTTEYNGVIAATVAALNVGRAHPILLMDANGYFAELVQDGHIVNGILLTSDFISGGLFSLDGVHPGFVGYALIANRFIETMNSGWSLAIEAVDVAEYLDQNPVFSPVAPEELNLQVGFGETIRALF
ncbi:MAG: hypothetical protein ISR91_07290 [Candidatus Delongbacteria bacterium]|nr:hypothetical protein [Candidatus Delongbacteria bacterium]